nr:MAG TPA: hypothetical protein [Caudoviricetes sp.]DAI84886.1 MAG TPA: hypothetical protein [Caudoviricetes sp.]DAT63562.1 MAG TPA: hypothetical protein [Caudoviricetes sp.]
MQPARFLSIRFNSYNWLFYRNQIYHNMCDY